MLDRQHQLPAGPPDFSPMRGQLAHVVPAAIREGFQDRLAVVTVGPHIAPKERNDSPGAFTGYGLCHALRVTA